MEIQRRGEPGHEIPVVLHHGNVYDLRPVTRDIDGDFLARGGVASVRAALERGELTPIDVSGTRVGAPVARPSAVICIGQNYAAHAAETGDPAPADPIIFFKHPNTVVGPFDTVLLPPDSAKTDWEVELAIVIGARARYLESPAEARACIAGFAISNDLSERTYQVDLSGGQWSKGKSCETFNPLGPSLVPADEVDVTGGLRMRSFVNGEPRQDSTTADMIFDVFQLVYELSQFMVLEPGDVINSGTPQGVAMSGRFPFLQVGDVVDLSIEGLGEQRQQVQAAAGVASGGVPGIRRAERGGRGASPVVHAV